MFARNLHRQYDQLEKSVISVLAYFDLFNFPVTREEIYLFMDRPCSIICLNVVLAQLEKRKIVYRISDYYAVRNDGCLASRRDKGAAKATELLRIAEKISALLIKFPFVRGVAISGSLSKRYADEKSDIDFFVITATGKLWIARTFLHLFKKLTFIFHKQDYFCMNYFVDEKNAEISEQNLFTAIETVTLIPMQGDLTFEKFYSKNAWTRHFLPNNILRISQAKAEKRRVLKIVMESLFYNALGQWMNNWLMKVTAKRWQQKTAHGKLNARGVLMSMVAGEGFAKPDPVNFQHKVLEGHQRNLISLLDA